MPSELQDSRPQTPWHTLSIHELATSTNLSELELHDLVRHEIVVPIDTAEPQWMFRADCVFRVRKACRLRDDLELDMHAVALTILLLDRIDVLEGQISTMSFRARIHHP